VISGAALRAPSGDAHSKELSRSGSDKSATGYSDLVFADDVEDPDGAGKADGE
jgi:hypothetical protein